MSEFTLFQKIQFHVIKFNLHLADYRKNLNSTYWKKHRARLRVLFQAVEKDPLNAGTYEDYVKIVNLANYLRNLNEQNKNFVPKLVAVTETDFTDEAEVQAMKDYIEMYQQGGRI